MTASSLAKCLYLWWHKCPCHSLWHFILTRPIAVLFRAVGRPNFLRSAHSSVLGEKRVVGREGRKKEKHSFIRAATSIPSAARACSSGQRVWAINLLTTVAGGRPHSAVTCVRTFSITDRQTALAHAELILSIALYTACSTFTDLRLRSVPNAGCNLGLYRAYIRIRVLGDKNPQQSQLLLTIHGTEWPFLLVCR